MITSYQSRNQPTVDNLLLTTDTRPERLSSPTKDDELATIPADSDIPLPQALSQVDKLVLAIKDLGTFKWFNVQNNSALINKNDTKKMSLFTGQLLGETIPENVGIALEVETVKNDVVKRERGPKANNISRNDRVPMKSSQYSHNQHRFC